MLYKCAEGIEKIDVNEYIVPSQSSLRGHSKKLYKKRLKKDVRKYNFPDKVIGNTKNKEDYGGGGRGGAGVENKRSRQIQQ